jgi:hypothetical protein
MVAVVMTMATVEHPDLLRREDLSRPLMLL